MKICAIAAVSKNNVIGKDGNLPWDLPEDLKHFRSTTINSPLIMGRKTFDSFPSPLPDREHIILTRNESLNSSNEKVNYVNSVDEAINLANEITNDKVYVIGGQSIYELFFDYLDTMILTHIHQKYNGDTHFPEFEVKNWNKNIITRKEKFIIVYYDRK